MKTIRYIAEEEIQKLDVSLCDCDVGDFAEAVLVAYLAQQQAVFEVRMSRLFAHAIIMPVVEGDYAVGTKLYLAPPIPAGMVLVPIEPTEAMLGSIAQATLSGDPVNIYKAMLNAVKEGKL